MGSKGHRSSVATFVAIALGAASGAEVNQKDDRREKAKAAKELAEKGQQYAMSKAQEYFSQ